MSWNGGGVFDLEIMSADRVLVTAIPSGWTVTNLKIAKIDGSAPTYGAVTWNGLTFTLASGVVDVSGAPTESGIFTLSIEAAVSNGTRTETLAGEIEFLIRPKPENIQASSFVESDPSKWTLLAMRGGGGSYTVEISVPMLPGVRKVPDDVYVCLAGLPNAAFEFDNGVLYVTGVVPNRTALESIVLRDIDCSDKDEPGLLREQIFDPAATYENIGTKIIDGEGLGNGGGGCNAGAFSLFGAAVAVAMLRKKLRPNLGR
jgi:hypothetical protein